MRTLDEAIAHEREKSKEQKSKYDKCPTRLRYDCEMCFHNPKCDEDAKEHEQLAEWLEELKALRHEANEWRKAGYSHGYNKAIDDFAENLKIKAHKKISLQSFLDESDLVDEDQIREMIDETAEQLKAGGENESK